LAWLNEEELVAKKRLFDQIAQRVNYGSMVLTKRVVQKLHAVRKQGRPGEVVFVAGVQRSGTNMIMDVLERSYDTDVYHERDGRAFDNYEMRPRELIHRLVKASNAPRVVLKALCELQDLRELLDEFAPAKGVWVLRNFEDVVNSHNALWNGMPRCIGEIVKDRNGAAGWRGRGMSNSTHTVISKLYRPDISNASACALFWYFRNILYFEQGLDQDRRVYLLRYESMVCEPMQQFPKLFDFLGINYPSDVSNKVFASSIRKRPAPDIDATIRNLCESLTARFEPFCPR
jgi:hypothetical protein